MNTVPMNVDEEAVIQPAHGEQSDVERINLRELEDEVMMMCGVTEEGEIGEDQEEHQVLDQVLDQDPALGQDRRRPALCDEESVTHHGRNGGAQGHSHGRDLGQLVLRSSEVGHQRGNGGARYPGGGRSDRLLALRGEGTNRGTNRGRDSGALGGQGERQLALRGAVSGTNRGRNGGVLSPGGGLNEGRLVSQGRNGRRPGRGGNGGGHGGRAGQDEGRGRGHRYNYRGARGGQWGRCRQHHRRNCWCLQGPPLHVRINQIIHQITEMICEFTGQSPTFNQVRDLITGAHF